MYFISLIQSTQAVRSQTVGTKKANGTGKKESLNPQLNDQGQKGHGQGDHGEKSKKEKGS